MLATLPGLVRPLMLEDVPRSQISSYDQVSISDVQLQRSRSRDYFPMARSRCLDLAQRSAAPSTVAK